MRSTDSEAKTDLKKAQLAWIAFRDAWASLSSEIIASKEPSQNASLSRKVILTEKRTSDLKPYLLH